LLGCDCRNSRPEGRLIDPARKSKLNFQFFPKKFAALDGGEFLAPIECVAKSTVIT